MDPGTRAMMFRSRLSIWAQHAVPGIMQKAPALRRKERRSMAASFAQAEEPFLHEKLRGCSL